MKTEICFFKEISQNVARISKVVLKINISNTLSFLILRIKTIVTASSSQLDRDSDVDKVKELAVSTANQILNLDKSAQDAKKKKQLQAAKQRKEIAKKKKEEEKQEMKRRKEIEKEEAKKRKQEEKEAIKKKR